MVDVLGWRAVGRRGMEGEGDGEVVGGGFGNDIS